MSPSAPAVLLLTHSADHFTVERVAAALEARGARTTRFDTDCFPGSLRLSVTRGSESAHHRFEAAGTWHDLAEFDAVWSRRIWNPRLDPDLDERFREGCLRESREVLRGFLGGLAHARWINPREADLRARDKLLQLEKAAEHGLATPRTLTTNDPRAVREFFDEAGGAIITKMQTPLSVSMGRAPMFVRTSSVRAEDLEHLGGLAHSPMIFQERIPKDVELRVVHVAGEFFIGAIDASASAAGGTDWRAATIDEVAWEREAIPDEVAERLRALLDELGLIYGAIDLIRTPSGEHVFLEVNPCGEWGMLERDLDHDISGALARALLTKAPTKASAEAPTEEPVP